MKKVIVPVLSMLAGAVVSGGVIKKKGDAQRKIAWSYSDKHLALFQMMDQWVKVKQQGKNLSSYLEKHGYKKIAIYGMSYAGTTLVEELKDTSVEVAYGIDKNAEALYADIEVVSAEDTLEEVDAIVVTAITFFDEIEEMLTMKVDCPIISLEDILYEV